jgi:pyruvate/2-oxoglutarate dehydrogenase complex dihydrolipoamide dehydrogenase (E3) component
MGFVARPDEIARRAMAERYDAVVLGMGPGGEVAASRLIKGGKRIAIVEKELIGGECAYWACIPSKTLLRPPEARSEAGRAFGTATPTLELESIFDYRDWIIRGLDDSGQVRSYEKKGATIVKGEGRITGAGVVEVNGEALEAEHIIVATGSAPNMPPIEGLEEVTVWTNREATTSREVPSRALIVGGGPNGIEAAQWLSRFGSEVTIVQSPERLINREDEQVSELMKGYLEEEGIEVRAGRRAVKARKDGPSALVELDDGAEIGTDVVVIAAGRKPRIDGIGLESVGVEANGKSLPIDERCRLAEGVWAIGARPGYRCSPTWPSTRPAWLPTTSWARTEEPTTAASRGSSSPTPRSPPRVLPSKGHASKGWTWPQRPWI